MMQVPARPFQGVPFLDVIEGVMRMRANAAALAFGLLFAASGAWAQATPPSPVVSSTQAVPTATSPDYSAVYCSGFVTADKVPDDTRIISGEQSNIKIVFSRGDYVFLSKGSNQGVKVGDRFSVVRPVTEPTDVQWFKWQNKLMKAMGSVYADEGHVRVIRVEPNTSTAVITFSCDYMQRGDIVRPYQERPSPAYKPIGEFDHFAPPSGKAVGMLVMGHTFTQLFGKNSTAYINLGNAQGVKEGDYIRFFRNEGTVAETAPNLEGFQYKMYGFGSTPVKYKWNDLPREVLGEGVVINVSRNSATVFITFTSIDVFAGDYVEIE
jgi:hypothetical protein